MTFAKEFGERMRDARVSCGMTQQDLAQQIGVKTPCINHYENGRRMPNVIRFAMICNALDVTADDLLPDLCDDDMPIDENQTNIFDMIGE